jgi:hypothetical protein
VSLAVREHQQHEKLDGLEGQQRFRGRPTIHDVLARVSLDYSQSDYRSMTLSSGKWFGPFVLAPETRGRRAGDAPETFWNFLAHLPVLAANHIYPCDLGPRARLSAQHAKRR